MNNNFNINTDTEKILRQKGLDPKEISAEKAKNILSKLSAEDTKKINAILKDKAALEKLLNSQTAKNLMEKFMGNNGAK